MAGWLFATSGDDPDYNLQARPQFFRSYDQASDGCFEENDDMLAFLIQAHVGYFNAYQ